MYKWLAKLTWALTTLVIVVNLQGQEAVPAKSKNDKGAKVQRQKPSTDSRIVAQQFSLIRNYQGILIKELGLLDYQIGELQDIETEWRQQIKEFNRDSKTAKERFQFIHDLSQEIDQKIKDTILPAQAERLEQLAIQKFVGANRAKTAIAHALTNPVVQEKLGLTRESYQEFRAQANDINQALQEKIAKLQEEANAEIMALLSAEQQASLKKVVGQPYAFASRERDH